LKLKGDGISYFSRNRFYSENYDHSLSNTLQYEKEEV